jgi:hypothetical protein
MIVPVTVVGVIVICPFGVVALFGIVNLSK